MRSREVSGQVIATVALRRALFWRTRNPPVAGSIPAGPTVVAGSERIWSECNVSCLRTELVVRKRWLVLALVSVAVLGASCGSSGKSATTRATSQTTSNTFGGSGSSEFCAFVSRVRTTFSAQSGGRSTPAQTKVLYEKLGPLLRHAGSIAPDIIKADFDAYVKGYQRFLGVLAAA